VSDLELTIETESESIPPADSFSFSICCDVAFLRAGGVPAGTKTYAAVTRSGRGNRQPGGGYEVNRSRDTLSTLTLSARVGQGLAAIRESLLGAADIAESPFCGKLRDALTAPPPGVSLVDEHGGSGLSYHEAVFGVFTDFDAHNQRRG